MNETVFACRQISAVADCSLESQYFVFLVDLVDEKYKLKRFKQNIDKIVTMIALITPAFGDLFILWCKYNFIAKIRLKFDTDNFLS